MLLSRGSDYKAGFNVDWGAGGFFRVETKREVGISDRKRFVCKNISRYLYSLVISLNMPKEATEMI